MDNGTKENRLDKEEKSTQMEEQKMDIGKTTDSLKEVIK
jgi:hypothetical protein